MATIHDEHYDVDVLNGLIETTLDSVNGYAEAAREADKPGFTQLFESRAAERRELAQQLQDAVRALGGTPEDSGSAMAAAHRQFLEIRNAFSRGDPAVRVGAPRPRPGPPDEALGRRVARLRHGPQAGPMSSWCSPVAPRSRAHGDAPACRSPAIR